MSALRPLLRLGRRGATGSHRNALSVRWGGPARRQRATARTAPATGAASGGFSSCHRSTRTMTIEVAFVYHTLQRRARARFARCSSRELRDALAIATPSAHSHAHVALAPRRSESGAALLRRRPSRRRPVRGGEPDPLVREGSRARRRRHRNGRVCHPRRSLRPLARLPSRRQSRAGAPAGSGEDVSVRAGRAEGRLEVAGPVNSSPSKSSARITVTFPGRGTESASGSLCSTISSSGRRRSVASSSSAST